MLQIETNLSILTDLTHPSPPVSLDR